MLKKILLTLAVVALLLMPAAASAQNLFPLALGMHYDYDGLDFANPPHHWQCRMQVVAQNITISTSVFPNLPPLLPTPQIYFHLRQINPDPYSAVGNVAVDLLIRSTPTQAFFSAGDTSSPPLEWLQFQTGTPATPAWFVPSPDGQSAELAQIFLNPSITVPYGTFPTSENTFTASINNVPTIVGQSYLAPALGLIKQINYQVDASRVQAILALRQIGTEPFLLFPLKSGMRLTYNASDNQNHTWQMTLQVLEQVTINDGVHGPLPFFHMRQVNYDPIGGNVSNDFYGRCTDSQFYVQKFKDQPEPTHIEYQAASPGLEWNYPIQPFPTIFKRINSITPVNVLGGGYLAYVTQQSPDPAFPTPTANTMYEYMVPGLGPVQMQDYWIADDSRAPLNFTLVKVSQGGPNQALLLLME